MISKRFSGFSTVEIIIGIAIAGLLITALALLLGRIVTTYRGQFSQVLSTEDLRNRLTRINATIQNARNVDVNSNGNIDTGEEWLLSAGDNEIKVYSNADDDPDSEVVHYYLDGTSLYRGVVNPDGEGQYNLDSEAAVKVSDNVANIANNKPLFTFYSYENPSIALAADDATASNVHHVDLWLEVTLPNVPQEKIITAATSTFPRRGSVVAAGATTLRLWPLTIHLPANALTQTDAQLSWVDTSGEGNSYSQIVSMFQLNNKRLNVYAKGYPAALYYQAVTYGSLTPGWYAHIGPILVGEVGGQAYYQTDVVPLISVCKGATLEYMVTNCSPRVVSSNGLQTTYQPILVYTDPTTHKQDYVSDIDTGYTGPSGSTTPTPSPNPSTSPSPTPVPTPGNCPAPDIPNILAHWKLDEGSGVSTADSSGAGHTGTLQNGLSSTWSSGTRAPTTFPNPFGLIFDSSDDYITTTGTPDNGGSITLAAWVYPTDTSPGNKLIVGTMSSLDTVNNGYSLYLIRGNNGNSLNFIYTSGTQGAGMGTLSTFPNNTWTHVAAVYKDTVSSNNQVTLYINGVAPDGTGNSNPFRVISSGTAKLGGFGVGTDYFGGVIDDVRVYSRDLSTAEIQELATVASSTCP